MGETIELRNVDALHGGQAELVVAHPGDDAPRAAAVIRRGAQINPFLGPDGWQQVEHAFAPSEAYREGAKLVLRYGSDMVDNSLRDDDIIQISLPDLDLADVVAWSGITRSVTVSDTQAPKPTAPEAPAEPLAPARPGMRLGAEDGEGRPTLVVEGAAPRDELGAVIRRDDARAPFLGPRGWQAAAHRFAPEARRDVDGRTILTLDPGRKAGAAAAGTKVTITVPELDLSTTATWPGDVAPEPRRGLLRAALLAAGILLVVGLGAWWVLSRDDDHTESVGPEPSDPPDHEAGVDPGPPRPDLPPGQAAYERAIAALDAGDCTAARADMLVAVDADYGPALLSWAEAQDSVDFEPCLTESENDVSAVEHFTRACEAGAEGAPDALATFVTALEGRADAGDPVAAEVLRLAIAPAQEACGP